MPTISAHVDHQLAETVAKAAKLSPDRKVGPWLAKAAQQRLERDGVANPDEAEFAAKVAVGVKKRPEVKAEIESLLKRGLRAARAGA